MAAIGARIDRGGTQCPPGTDPGTRPTDRDRRVIAQDHPRRRHHDNGNANAYSLRHPRKVIIIVIHQINGGHHYKKCNKKTKD